MMIFWEEYHFETYSFFGGGGGGGAAVIYSLVDPNVIHSSSVLDICSLYIVMMPVIYEQKLHEVLRLHYS